MPWIAVNSPLVLPVSWLPQPESPAQRPHTSARAGIVAVEQLFVGLCLDGHDVRRPAVNASLPQALLDPGHYVSGQLIARRARHVPHLNVAPALHLVDEPASALRDGGDKRPSRIEELPRGVDERGREALHLADFVNEIYRGPASRIQRVREPAEGAH